MEKYKLGRGNIALTIFVPNDCEKNCAFCTTKTEYKNVNKNKIDDSVYLFAKNNKSIKEVVFTGGEPLKSIEFMKNTIDLIREYNDGIKFYINTEFRANAEDVLEFIKFCKDYKIDGVSISRHENHLKSFDVTYINFLCEFTNVRLNHIENNNLMDFITNCNDEDLHTNVQLNIRADYRFVTKDDLHTKENGLLNQYDLLKHTQCNVCDTKAYYVNGRVVSYHRGLTTSTIIHENGIKEVNDVIIKPDGNIYLDWNNEYETTENILKVINSKIDLKLQFFSCGSPTGRC